MRTDAKPFGIIAHRGLSAGMRENTPEAFRRARALGADAVELDVRLTRDRVPIVHHNWYLDQSAPTPTPIFNVDAASCDAPRLADVLEEFGGRLGLEIELKDPAVESADIVCRMLQGHRAVWDAIEVTSFDASVIRSVTERCTGLATALLFPASEPWMRADVVAYSALHRAAGCGAAGVHLAANQLTEDVVRTIHGGGVDVHAHTVDDEEALRLCQALRIPWVCTNETERALAYRQRVAR